MPTYDYKCDQCGHCFEEFQYFSEELLKVCPKCQQQTLRRLFGSGAAVLFKGSGFYETDYRSESYKTAAKAESESPKTPASGGTAGNNGTTSSGSGETGKKSDANPSKSTT
jgi:putative FmdB family regulatory protein